MDITKLEGYKPEMTAEEKLALVEACEPVGYIKKESFDKTASELAEAKRQLKAKMTDDEQKEAERLAADEAIRAELEALRRDKTISETKARFLGLGYDAELANEAAVALAAGEMDKVFASQAKHLENVKKAATAESVANESTPPAGRGGNPDNAERAEQNKLRAAAGLPPLKE